MTTYTVDTETDGFLPELTQILSLVIENVDTGDVYSCCDDPDYEPEGDFAFKLTISAGIEFLADLNASDTITAHNWFGFDGPAIRKVYPGWTTKATCRDTLILSKLIWSDMWASDEKEAKRKGKASTFPLQYRGRHSLAAWGHRLGEYKDDYTGGFEKWSPEMQRYCEQDVTVLTKLWKLCVKKQYAEFAVEIESDFAFIIQLQEDFGFPVYRDKIVDLYTTLCQRRLELDAEIVAVFPAWWRRGKHIVPKRTANYKDITRASVVEGCPYTVVTYTTFNANSEDHIAERLKALRGWKPQAFTPNGKPKVTDDILADLPWPEAAILAESLMVAKRIGMVGEGKKAWLKFIDSDGRIHGRVNTLGAITRRCTHNDPNLAQVTSTQNAKGTVPYGKESRACFGTIPGYKLVGCDASGLELRCLAHYMAAWDEGAYADQVVSGDVHTANQLAAGLPSRDNAKTFI